MAKRFEEQEFQASVSDQDGLLRSRVPTPMLKALKTQHGDLIHYTMTGPDTVEVKVRRGRGFSGEKPYITRETSGNGKGTEKKSVKASTKKGTKKKSAQVEKPGKSSGKAAKKGTTKKKVLFDLGDLI